MDKELNDLSTDNLHILIRRNAAHFRKEAKLNQLELSLEMGNKSPNLLSSAEIFKNKRHFNVT